MLTCEQALELISAQLDGALTAEEAGALDEHLAQCPACRALRADLSTLHQLLPTLAEEPPAGLKDNIMKAVTPPNAPPSTPESASGAGAPGPLWPRCWCLYWWAGRLCTSGALRTAPGAYPEPILPG